MAAEPHRLTRLQLNSLAADPEACHAALDRAPLSYLLSAERPITNGCGLVDGVTLMQTRVAYSSTFDLTCHAAAALYLYEGEFDRLAEKHMGSGLARIDHFGTFFACRNIAGTTRRSQHATANAIDIAGFVLDDGRRLSILPLNERGPEHSLRPSSITLSPAISSGIRAA